MRKMDWADHEAYSVMDKWVEDNVDGSDMEVLGDFIAASLRAAHKRGMVEAATIAETARKGGQLPEMPGQFLCGWALGSATDAAEAIRARIAQLEKPD